MNDLSSFEEPNSIEFVIFMLIYNHVPDEKSLVIGSRYAKKIILINNNSSVEVAEKLERLKTSIGHKCEILNYESNLGVSKAYNKAINSSMIKYKTRYLLLLDHDAIFDEKYFNKLFSALGDFKDKDFGVIVPIVSDEINYMGSNLNIFSKYSEIESSITSGIFMRSNLFNKIGGFDESLFVEAADYEFTRRIITLGYPLIRINTVLIIQEFEIPVVSADLITRAFNFFIKIRSIIRIKFNNCNIFRVKLSHYNVERERELFKNLKHLSTIRRKESPMLSLVILLDYIEILLVDIRNKIIYNKEDLDASN